MHYIISLYYVFQHVVCLFAVCLNDIFCCINCTTQPGIHPNLEEGTLNPITYVNMQLLFSWVYHHYKGKSLNNAEWWKPWLVPKYMKQYTLRSPNKGLWHQQEMAVTSDPHCTNSSANKVPCGLVPELQLSITVRLKALKISQVVPWSCWQQILVLKPQHHQHFTSLAWLTYMQKHGMV